MEFTYDEYGRLIERIQASGFTIGKMQPAAPGERKAWLRHDIDMSVDDAFRLAGLEEQLGVVSTYHVMLDTNFYNVMASRENSRLRSMAAMGHDIGLHYVDHGPASDGTVDGAALMAGISSQCGLLSEALGFEVESFSFHRPGAHLLQAPVVIPGLSNAYAQPYFVPGAYISDSNHHWKCGDPFAFVESFGGDSLQVLTHPFWWTTTPEDPARKLRRFVERLTAAHTATLVHDIGLASAVFGDSAR